MTRTFKVSTGAAAAGAAMANSQGGWLLVQEIAVNTLLTGAVAAVEIAHANAMT
jgi:hypothetical protein